eukprot:jgi/Astpho2/5601/gw1.00079.217.1_t
MVSSCSAQQATRLPSCIRAWLRRHCWTSAPP